LFPQEEQNLSESFFLFFPQLAQYTFKSCFSKTCCDTGRIFHIDVEQVKRLKVLSTVLNDWSDEPPFSTLPVSNESIVTSLRELGLDFNIPLLLLMFGPSKVLLDAVLKLIPPVFVDE
jgi:hypothetical protein